MGGAGTVLGRALFRGAVVWLFVIAGLAVFGVFLPGPGEGAFALVAAAAVPPLVFVFLYRRFADVRTLALSLDLRAVTLIHGLRLAALALLLAPAQGQEGLPLAYSVPALWGGFLIGASAPFIALVLLRTRPVPWGNFALWNLAGLAELGISTALLVLAGPGAWGLLATGQGPTTAAMMGFPLALVPTFLVPLFAILHLIALAQAGARARQGGLAA